LAGLAGAASGCGGSALRAPKSGAAVFQASCSSCHSLSGHANEHQQGGDLLGYAMSRAQLRQFTAEMPARHPLSPDQLQAVTDYVLAAQRRAGPAPSRPARSTP